MADTMTGNKDGQQYATIQPRMSPPIAGPGSHSHSLPVQNNNTTTLLGPTMARDPEATPTSDDIHALREREKSLHAQSNESKTRANDSRTQPSRANSARNSQQPDSANNSNSTKNRNTGPSKAPAPFTATAAAYDASITIQSLQQQLFIAEHHQTQIRYEAAQQFHQLQTVTRSTYDRATHLEANVHYLSAELEKANSYNATLNEHVRGLRADMEVKEVQHKAALKAAKAKAGGSKAAGSSSARILAAPTATPAPTPAVTLSPNDARTRTLLEHNRTTIRSLRTEIRTLKTANKQVQDRLLELRSAPAVDGRAVLQNSDMPGEVLREWSEVLLEKDRKIAGLGVLLERETEAR
jgi:hypothetical protein